MKEISMIMEKALHIEEAIHRVQDAIEVCC